MTSSIRTDMGVALLTKEGGHAFPSINGTGSTSVPGTLVIQSNSADETFEEVQAGNADCIGIVYNAVADGEVGWVVHTGRGRVLLESGTGCSSGDSLGVSESENGRAVAGADDNLIGIATETVDAPSPGESASAMAIILAGRTGIIHLVDAHFWSYFPGGFY